MRKFAVATAICAALIVTGCKETIPPEALKLSAQSLEDRQAQTRRFDTSDETKLLMASAAVLQDLGFNIDESETKLGLIVGSKVRDATEAGQVAGAIFAALLLGVAIPIDDTQKIRVSLVTSPLGESGKKTAVRITFQRLIWNTKNQLSTIEALEDPKLYQDFFSNLSKSIFLEANKI